MSNMVIIEIMPDDIRSSHRAARNFGVFPLNGAQRYIVDRTVADEYLDDEDGYNHIVRDANDGDIGQYDQL
jgi:hypothetical protein